MFARNSAAGKGSYRKVVSSECYRKVVSRSTQSGVHVLDYVCLDSTSDGRRHIFHFRFVRRRTAQQQRQRTIFSPCISYCFCRLRHSFFWSPRGNRRCAMRSASRTPHILEHDCIKSCQDIRHRAWAYWGSGIRLVRCLFSFIGGVCWYSDLV